MDNEMGNGKIRLRNEDGLSPTREIYNRLKPYWEAKKLDDQDWAVILLCLRKVERKCATCVLSKQVSLKNRHHAPHKAQV